MNNEHYTRDYANDCIHLKACRRICKYNKLHNRGCMKEYCTAYENIEDYMLNNDLFTRDEVKDVMNGALEDGHKGYYQGDILISDYINK